MRQYAIGKFGRPDKKRRDIHARRDSLKHLAHLNECALRDLGWLEREAQRRDLSKGELDQVQEAKRYIAQYQDYLRDIRLRPFRDARPKKLQRKLAYENPEPYEGREAAISTTKEDPAGRLPEG